MNTKRPKMQLPKMIDKINYQQIVVSLYENYRNPLAKCNCNSVNMKKY